MDRFLTQARLSLSSKMHFSTSGKREEMRKAARNQAQHQDIVLAHLAKMKDQLWGHLQLNSSRMPRICQITIQVTSRTSGIQDSSSGKSRMSVRTEQAIRKIKGRTLKASLVLMKRETSQS